MPEADRIVINTGPIFALVAAQGDLNLLDSLYVQVVVPREVVDEVLAGGEAGFGVQALKAASFLCIEEKLCTLPPLLRRSLDIGEAAVIQTAVNRRIDTVCIDETVGRRVARLHGLLVTGSLGVLIKAIRRGHDINLAAAMSRMRDRGVWISNATMESAITMVEQGPPGASPFT